MAGIFDEKNMMESLHEYVPDGEIVSAGIHAIGLQVHIIQELKEFIFEGKRVIAHDNMLLQVKKQKEASYDVYLGITENYLIMTQCEPFRYYYEINEIQDTGENSGENSGGNSAENEEAIPSQYDIGTCFSLSDINSCMIKNAWMGSVKCTITFKNGTLLKLMFPKLGGLGGGMPHHKEYRDAIIARLSKF